MLAQRPMHCTRPSLPAGEKSVKERFTLPEPKASAGPEPWRIGGVRRHACTHVACWLLRSLPVCHAQLGANCKLTLWRCLPPTQCRWCPTWRASTRLTCSRPTCAQRCGRGMQTPSGSWEQHAQRYCCNASGNGPWQGLWCPPVLASCTHTYLPPAPTVAGQERGGY